ncbi:YlcI/YnfO family protein [Candidatus Regiella insecticola]|uniref:YlcI/YnfO family protein n=1 Tax=Candidatus Regiella insecticola TaxID=138073 RepID=UPI001596B5CC|nr:YlcI/YnfO family protein [Candidatus Regiella insecticola]
MTTKATNAKSQTLAARVPHEVVSGMEESKEHGETTGQFIVASMRGEIKRRQREKSKPDESKG